MPEHGYRHLNKLSLAEKPNVASSRERSPSTRDRSPASSARQSASLNASPSKSGSESTPSERRSLDRATAAHANEFEWVIDPTNPGGQRGARSRPTPTVTSRAPASRSACSAQWRPAANSRIRFSRPCASPRSHTCLVARARTHGPTIEGGLVHARGVFGDATTGKTTMIRKSDQLSIVAGLFPGGKPPCLPFEITGQGLREHYVQYCD